MNEWQRKANEFKKNLKELDEWFLSERRSLLEGVMRVIIRGQILIEEKIEKYETWAKEEQEKT